MDSPLLPLSLHVIVVLLLAEPHKPVRRWRAEVAACVLLGNWEGERREGRHVGNREAFQPGSRSATVVPPGRGGGFPPPLPQIRTCPFKAFGSSCNGLDCAVLTG